MTMKSPVLQSSIRQNFHVECEKSLNKQINLELYASQAYLAMYSFFIQQDQAMDGFAMMFMEQSKEEREHGVMLIEYQAKRGGKVDIKDIKKPNIEINSVKEAVETALKIEKEVNESLLDIHALAGSKKDGSLSDFLEEYFLREQVDAIKELGDLLTKIEMAGDGLGVIYVNSHLLDIYGKK